MCCGGRCNGIVRILRQNSAIHNWDKRPHHSARFALLFDTLFGAHSKGVKVFPGNGLQLGQFRWRKARLLEHGHLGFFEYSFSPDFRKAPLNTTALWNSPFALGMAVKMQTLVPPPDCPMIVMLSGSPPKLEILARTHSRAATMSSMPALPDAANSSPPTRRNCSNRMALSGG